MGFIIISYEINNQETIEEFKKIKKTMFLFGMIPYSK